MTEPIDNKAMRERAKQIAETRRAERRARKRKCVLCGIEESDKSPLGPHPDGIGSRSHHDGSLPVVGRRVLGLDDVGDEHGHVVGSSRPQREVDQLLGSFLRAAVPEHLSHRRLGDDTGEPVAAEQVPITGFRPA